MMPAAHDLLDRGAEQQGPDNLVVRAEDSQLCSGCSFINKILILLVHNSKGEHLVIIPQLLAKLNTQSSYWCGGCSGLHGYVKISFTRQFIPLINLQKAVPLSDIIENF